MVWVCPHDEDHVFEEKSDSGLCPTCTGFSFLEARKKEGIFPETSEVLPNPDLEERYRRLVIEGNEEFKLENFAVATAKFEQAWAIFPDRDDFEGKINHTTLQPSPIEPPVGSSPQTPEGALGLCVLLMDASGSMFQPNAFKDSKYNRAQVVAKAAAVGIMSLKENKRAKHAYLAAYKFDHRVKPIFIKSLAEITTEYDTVAKLEHFLYTTMENEMGGETDINAALQTAYHLVSDFLNQKIKAFREPRGDKDYPIITRPVSNRKTMGQVEVPNVRVFIYTDGMQFVNGESTPLVNPFENGGELPNNQVDILLGAFIGSPTNKGCQELKAILSECPEHDHLQFFLIENPEDAIELSGVFRMASGHSGFCEKCIEKDHNQKGGKTLEPSDDLDEMF